jgi:excinuclease UvrABC nuclease subunit
MPYAWRPKLADLPERPGVYIFRSARGDVLYIGKAVNLRRRIASYFHRRRQPPRLRRMIRRARSVTLHETDSELEALLLESRLLKREAPVYNRLSTAYVALPFVKLTLGEAFPRIMLTRELILDGSHYLGPFPRLEIAAPVLGALQRLFPLRTCEVTVRPGLFPAPCEAYQLRKCAAPCVSPQAALTYQRHVAALLALLTRGQGAIAQRLREARQQAADGLHFERARHLHMTLTAFDYASVARPLSLLPVALRNFVVIFTAMVPQTYEIFCIHHGRFAGRTVCGGQAGDWQRLESFLTRAYGALDEGLGGGEALVDELRIVAGWLQRTRARARWVHLERPFHPATALAAVRRALA